MRFVFQRKQHGYTILELLFVIVLLGLFMLIAYQQIQQSNFRRGLATLHGSVNTLEYAMTQYFYEHCATIYSVPKMTVQLSSLAPYYPSGATAVSNPFNQSNPQAFTLSFTRAVKATGTATMATIVVQFSKETSPGEMGVIASTVRPTALNDNTQPMTMTWTFSPFRAISDAGVPQASRASLAVYNIWASGKDIPGAKESCDYLEYYYQTQAD